MYVWRILLEKKYHAHSLGEMHTTRVIFQNDHVCVCNFFPFMIALYLLQKLHATASATKAVVACNSQRN
jgi:hypothetical protein